MHKLYIHIIFTTLALASLSACNDDSAIADPGGDILLNTHIEASMQWLSSRDGSEPIPGKLPETIGVFAENRTAEIEVFDNQLMYNPEGTEVLDDAEIDLQDWMPGVWPYKPLKRWMGGTYYFYCYAPYSSTNAKWINGMSYYTFHLYNIPPLSATEYAVGRYRVTKESGNNPSLTLTHITARLRFLFAIGEKYSELRTIRITSIKISDSGNGTPYWECEVDLDRDEPVINVTESSVKYVSTEDIELIAENDPDDPAKPGQRLTTEYKSFSSAYNLLGKIDNTNLTVVYDVYDTADMLVRQNQTVTNRIDLRPFGDLERGKCYDIRILVSPKYLYVLSDNDAPPTAVIEPESSTTP